MTKSSTREITIQPGVAPVLAGPGKKGSENDDKKTPKRSVDDDDDDELDSEPQETDLSDLDLDEFDDDDDDDY